MIRSPILSSHINTILGAIRSVPVPAKPVHDEAHKAVPFVTISREPGAGALMLARELVAALNAAAPPDEQWTCWDRELIEKVAADLHVSTKLIDALEDQDHSWFTEFLESLAIGQDAQFANEAIIYQRVARTIRALAQAGRVVIVGRGGVFLTRKMPGGFHIRLVAPRAERIAYIAREYNLTSERAAARIHELEHNRKVFYRRYWSDEPLHPDLFSLTVNTADVPSDVIVQAIESLVSCHVKASMG